MSDAQGCPHLNFAAEVKVARIEDVGRFAAEVRIRCSQCGEPFRFLGLAAGVLINKPSCSVDGLELLAPIEPQGTPRLHAKSMYEIEPVPGKA